jgi:photosystem II stability/assembly factor-like uncharacterized protein
MYNFNESPLGVVRSSDGGVTWKEFNRGLRPDEVGVMAMDPTNPDKLYAASATGLARNNGATTLGLFRSTDRGNNWQTNTSLAVVGNIAALAINPVTPSTMYAGLYAGIFKSIDGGSSWSKLNLGANITAIAIDPATPATLYVGSYGGPFKSTDGGDSWNQINIGLPDSTVLSLAIDPVTPGTLYAGTYYGIYKSTNGGGNWSLINTGLTSSGVSKLVIDPVTPATVYAVTVGAYDGSEAPAVLKSTDRGTTWSRLVTGMLSSISDFAVDPVSPTTLYMAGYGGLVKSIDGGKSWGQLTGGATIISAYSVIIDPTHPATLYVGTNSGLYIVAQGTDVMVTPSSIDFGSTLPNNPVSRIITIKNSGIGPLVVSPSSSLVNRDESALFSVTPGGVNPCASLTPTLPEGGSCTLLVSFTPISTGAKSATFHIMTNAEGRAVVDLPLTGTGASSSYNLMLTVAGDGRGSVASTPTGIACNTNCSAIFDFNTLVNLHAKPADYSIFGGWSGGICTGSADCQVTITADVPVTAMFSKDTVHPVMIDGPTPVFYPSLQNACFAAVSGDTIKAWGTEFSGDILLGTAITIKGGFNSGYTANVGETTLHGLLTISIGQLTVEYLVVR